ncbi:multiple sugar transport system substrate-binding protein [Herbaspirillum seropedicae]|uniref:ABC transporter substrate-binding protein n=1 Tax=Herbaspirillum seropedicae TaxID=964 RepID=UPI003399B992
MHGRPTPSSSSAGPTDEVGAPAACAADSAYSAYSACSRRTWLRASAAATASLLLGCERAGKEESSTVELAPAQDTLVLNALVWAPDWAEEMQRVCDGFMHEHPGVRINLQFMIGNSVEENLKPRATTDSLPDIVSVNASPYTASLADQGLLADLGQTRSWNGLLDILQREWTAPGGCRFGLPSGVATTLIYYHPDLFERAGIQALPGDFEQFLAAGAALRRAGITPLALSGGFPNMLGNGPFSYGFANLVASSTPDWRQHIANGTLALDNAQGWAVFSHLRTLMTRQLVQADCLRAGYDATLRQFAEGRAAMTFQGSWAAGVLMQGRGQPVGVFVPPWNDKDQPRQAVIGSETGFAIAQRSSARHRQAAARFLDYLFGAGLPVWQGKRQNILPFKTPAPSAKGDAALFALAAGMARDAAATGAPGLYYSYLPVNTIDVLHALLPAVLSGKTTPVQAARALQESISAQARVGGK